MHGRAADKPSRNSEQGMRTEPKEARSKLTKEEINAMERDNLRKKDDIGYSQRISGAEISSKKELACCFSCAFCNTNPARFIHTYGKFHTMAHSLSLKFETARRLNEYIFA